MPESFQDVFSARQYLETYYPTSFDQEKFFLALQQVKESMDRDSMVDVKKLSQDMNFATEEGENAAIFHFLQEVATRLCSVFPDGEAVLLDVGGGPTIYQHIPLSLHVTSIIHGEYLSENRKEVLAYLEKEESSYTWGAYFSVVKKMLRESMQYQQKLQALRSSQEESVKKHAERVQNILESEGTELFEERVRNILKKNVVPCDVFSPSLSSPSDQELSQLLEEQTASGLAQIVSAHFLVESATDSLEKWKQGVENLMKKIAPQGFLVMTAIRHASWYRVGSERAPAVSVDEHGIQTFLEAHGMVIECIQVVTGSDQEHHGYDGMVFVLARKIQ